MCQKSKPPFVFYFEIVKLRAREFIEKLKETLEMGKHKTPRQDETFLSFMEQHPDIAKNYVKGDRVAAEALWAELAKELNSQGPPQKDINGWKKVWSDWKGCVRKKIAHNKSETRATGGGPFNQFVLSCTEEKIAELCGLYTCVEGIPQSSSFGVQCDNSNESSDDENPTPSTSAVATRTRRPNSMQACIKEHMATEAGAVDCISGTLGKLLESFDDTKNILKDSNGAVIKSMEKLCDLISIQNSLTAEQNEILRQHNSIKERIGKEKSDMKKRMLEIEEEKWEWTKRAR
ncbi:uncharacterized protein LOC126765722 [Bactrocera neohumeralis]|uniref:uncharacterized protein LOC126765722 n=1 Tax=Bactrocera neohumeralis TaxID=98809 RepID=UPI002165E493|nr:uncharacterized protein LOC126765722 [Bactrocera neohumeralis]